MQKPIISGAMELLAVVWRQSQRTRQHSWRCLNGSMHEALRLAVSSGMEFGVDDFRYMSEHFRMGYWCGDLEHFYTDAVVVRNASAWKAFEKYRARKPYFFAPAVVGGNVTPARLVVGTKFEWQGENVTVTSFNDEDTPHLNACSYVISKGTQCNRCHQKFPFILDEIATEGGRTFAIVQALAPATSRSWPPWAARRHNQVSSSRCSSRHGDRCGR
jgi:hypothetical protein